MIYTQKQRALMELWRTNRLKRINLLEGSVSSGKTWISLVLWAFWVKTMPTEGLYLMCAKSLTTLKRNCLYPLRELVGEDNFVFSVASKEGSLFGRKIMFEGANDARSESKIRGVTLQGAYCDELTQFPQDFFAMLLSRLRLAGAKLIATTNPDAPSHWLKENYIDRSDSLDFLDVKFLLDDNTTLPRDYVENIKLEYTGVFYERFILGRWTLAEGIIYPMYQEAILRPPDGPADKYVLSIDYGTQNPFSAGLWAKYGDVWYREREYYYGGRDRGIQKTDNEYLDDLNKEFGDITPGMSLTVIIDPSAASFIALLRKQHGRYAVRKANNAVLDGIRETAAAMKTGKIKISPDCKAWIKEAQGYVWDEADGEDRPVKVNDHCLTGEMMVDTENGPVAIRDMVGTTGKVWSYNVEIGRPELRRYYGCRMTQRNAEIYEIETVDGRKIHCTGDHPVLTKDGWKEAQALTAEDSIVEVVF